MPSFSPIKGRLRLGPGETKEVTIEPTARQRHWLGQPKLHPFELLAVSQSGQQQLQTGQLTVPPIIPTWQASLLGLLFVLLCAGGLSLILPLIRPDDPTVPIPPIGTVESPPDFGTATTEVPPHNSSLTE